MSATDCPERVAIETLAGNVRTGEVVACPTRIEHCRPVDYVRVQLEGHVLEVPEREAVPP
jgi:hypothetical protein